MEVYFAWCFVKNQTELWPVFLGPLQHNRFWREPNSTVNQVVWVLATVPLHKCGLRESVSQPAVLQSQSKRHWWKKVNIVTSIWRHCYNSFLLDFVSVAEGTWCSSASVFRSRKQRYTYFSIYFLLTNEQLLFSKANGNKQWANEIFPQFRTSWNLRKISLKYKLVAATRKKLVTQWHTIENLW